MGDNTVLKKAGQNLVDLEKKSSQAIMDAVSPDRLENYKPEDFAEKATETIENKVIDIKAHQIRNLNKDRALLKDELKSEKKDFKELKKEISKREKLDNKRADKKLKSDKEKLKDDIKKGNLSEKTIDERKVRIKYDNKDRRIRQQNNEFYKIKKSEKKDIKKEIKSTKKDIRKNNRKALKKQALVTSIKAKRELHKDFKTGSSLSSDNLLESGSQGVLGAINRALNNRLNPLEILKRKMLALFAAAMGQVQLMLLPVIPIIIAAIVATGAIASIASGILNFFGLGETESTGRSAMPTMDASAIDSIIAEREGITADQEKLLRYALSKVGCHYATEEEVLREENPISRVGPDSYDCSGLAYDVEKQIGKNITANTAAQQAKRMIEAGNYLTDISKEPQIGDLIYYADPEDAVREKNKNKWNHIYHVAIYAGNGYVVEAYGSDVGVIYDKLRSSNVYAICTP